MFKKKQVVKSWDTPGNGDRVTNSLIPAIKAIPDWFKKAPAIIDKDKKHYNYDGSEYVVDKKLFTGKNQYGETFKACTPMLDALTLGYVITTGEDVYFNEETMHFNNTSVVQQSTHIPFQIEGYEVPDWCHEMLFKWNSKIHLELPDGYTALYMMPLHRFDLPFYTLPGVIDGKHPLEVNTPFLIKKGFTGMIPEGTPIIQIIPFKIDDWKNDHSDEFKKTADDMQLMHDFFEFDEFMQPKAGVYKKKIRQRKIFE